MSKYYDGQEGEHDRALDREIEQALREDAKKLGNLMAGDADELAEKVAQEHFEGGADELAREIFLLAINEEKAPDGLDQHEAGAKLDDGKVLADDIMRMFARALWSVCELGTKGAIKYTLGGWAYVENGKVRYANAQMRHKFDEWIGGEGATDADTEVLHATADAWNVLARLELQLRERAGQADDDRG